MGTQQQRMNWLMINVAILAILGIAALVGILLAVGNSDEPPPPPTIQSQADARTLSSASAASIVDTKTVAISPGAGWKVLNKGTFYIDLVAPKGIGLLGVESGPLKNPNLTSYANSLLNVIAKRATNAKICGKAAAARVPNGPNGIAVPFCYTLVPQNSKAVSLFAYLLIGVSGQVGVAMNLTTIANTNAVKALVTVASPVVRTVKWKLLAL